MALTFATEYKGLPVPCAYLNIILPTIEADRTSMVFHAQLHTSVGGAVLQTEQHVCAYDLAGLNPFEQAYAHLKTLSEYASATDC